MRVEIDGVRYTPITQDNAELAELRQEREDVIKMLRDIAQRKVLGDNEWSDNLHLRDILEKHFFDYLE